VDQKTGACQERAALSAKDELERNVREVDRVLSESRMSRFLSSVKVEFDLAKFTTGLVVGGTTGTLFGVPLAIGAATGAMASAVSMTIAAGPRLEGLPDSARPFAYLGLAKRDLGAR
jgi:putative lipase involved disintegration of autophagic bodies